MQRVFILGAGASRAGGIPALKELTKYVATKPRVAHFLKEMFDVAHFQQQDELLPRLDDLYSLIDYALIHDHKLGSFSQDNLRALRRELNLGICQLFAKDSLAADYSGAVQVYLKFAQELDKEQDAVISLNWDTALDYVLDYQMGWPLNYGLRDNSEESFPLIKPHGSVNWAWCQACSQLTVIGYSFSQWKQLTCQTCGETNLNPLLVGPTALPSKGETPLDNCWLEAIKLIIQAERLYLVGLSLDSIDLDILEVVKRGMLLNKKKPQLYVLGRGCIPGKDTLLQNTTVKRYLQLFGPNTAFNMCGFEGSIPEDEKFTFPYQPY